MIHKRALSVALLLAFSGQFALFDAVSRGASRVLVEPRAWLALIGSILLWAAAALSARSRPMRALLALLSSSILVTELFFFSHYHSFLDLDAALCAKHNWPDVRAMVMRFLPWAAAATALSALVEYAWLGLTPQGKRRGALGLAALGACACALGPAFDRATPDLLGAWRVAGARRSR